MNGRIFFWSITSALAGFLFGFDTVVISGAEQKIQALWNLNSGMHGIAIASALYGTVLGSLLGSWPTDRFGRRATLILIGFLYLVGAIWSALASDIYSFIAARALRMTLVTILTRKILGRFVCRMRSAFLPVTALYWITFFSLWRRMLRRQSL